MTERGPHGPDREALARAIVDSAYLEGDFILSSGAHSSYYLDKYLFETRPEILRPLAEELAMLMPPDVDRIVGTELGAVALATALSLETGLPFVIARKGAKEYSTAKAIEGLLRPGDRTVVVEDVITSGAQAIRAARLVTDAGASVSAIIAVVDRDEGGAAKIEDAGFVLSSLFTRADLGLR
ncbi:MAG: orotate phosphoribosyltransferase [Candidatus Limnocylindrales bacterium]